jgi:hypothetical protein
VLDLHKEAMSLMAMMLLASANPLGWVKSMVQPSLL